MEITWQVDDGYAGKARPHTIKIPDSEFEHCTNEDEEDDIIQEWVQDDFNDKVSPIWKRNKY